jgi:DnaJ domain
MRFPGLFALVAILLPLLCAAWTAEDHEIFRLRDDIIAHEGPNTTFYSFLGVSKKASIDEINRAYRKRATRIHPDKARQSFIASYGKDKEAKAGASKKKPHPSERELAAFTKDAGERFARLGVIAGILRGPMRDRYDFFLDHGFPKWRGTGYYYQRYRPGVGTVLVGLFIVMGGFAHYGALVLGWKRQRDFAEKYIRDARKLAWGKDTVVPGLDTIIQPASVPAMNGNGNGTGNGTTNGTAGMNRKQKRAAEKENKKNSKKGTQTTPSVSTDEISAPVEATLISGPQGNKRRVVAENGKILIVDSVGNVFLEETTDEGETHEFLIDVLSVLSSSLILD